MIKSHSLRHDDDPHNCSTGLCMNSGNQDGVRVNFPAILFTMLYYSLEPVTALNTEKMLAHLLHLNKSVMHFPITALQSPAHSQPPQQGQTRRLGINDVTGNHIFNQTMT